MLVDVGLKFEIAEMQMIRWMCGISMKNRRRNEELRRMVGVEHITTVIRSGRLSWYVMRKGDEDWVKKCMEFRVEGRSPVERPRRIWLESVEANMAELEIDKEDVQPYRKMDYKPIIIIYHVNNTITASMCIMSSKTPNKAERQEWTLLKPF